MTSSIQWNQLKVRDRFIYKHQPIMQVICQITFPEKVALRGEDSSVVGEFQSQIDRDYPFTGVSYNASVDFSVHASGVPLFPSVPAARIPVRNFLDHDENWVVTLAPDFLALSCQNYTNFDDFNSRLRSVVDACVDTIKPTLLRRLGLRYINEIRSPDKDHINSELLGVLHNKTLGTAVLQAIQQVTLVDGENSINLNHGLRPSGTTVELRAGNDPPKDSFYLIDIDVAREFPKNSKMLVESRSVESLLRDFHEIESQLFRWSITDEYHQSLVRMT